MADIEVARIFDLLVIAGCLLYFVVSLEHPEKPPLRDLEREHRLGGHRSFRAAGCALCKREE